MKPIEQIRRENLAILVGAEPSQAAFARRVGKDKNQVNQWLGRAGSRNMSAETAREIEQICGKSRGWLDQDRTQRVGEESTPYPSSQAGRPDDARLSASITFLENQFRLWEREFIASERIGLITAVYDELSRPNPPTMVVLGRWLADRLQEEDDERKRKAGSAVGDDRSGDKRRTA